jgi:hypothetical protein
MFTRTYTEEGSAPGTSPSSVLGMLVDTAAGNWHCQPAANRVSAFQAKRPEILAL